MYRYEKIEHDQNLPIKLHDFFFDNYPSERISKHWHRSLEILIPLYGHIDLWINGDTKTTRAGNIYIINSEEIHEIIPHQDEQYYKGYALQIDYDYLKHCYSNIDKIYFSQPNALNNKLILEKTLDIIRYYNSTNEFNYIRIISHLQMLIFILMSQLSRNKTNSFELKNNKNKDRIIKILHYIDENYAENLSGSTISHKFYLSEGYLYKLFKENLNITLKQYINIVRINHAKDELINTSYPIIDIAINNGFPNVKSFNHIFKEKIGISPKKYRDKMKSL